MDGYLQLAKAWAQDRSPEAGLLGAARELPAPDPAELDEWFEQALRAACFSPRLAWAMQATAEAALAPDVDPFVRALAAWRLGYVSSLWERRDLAQAALDRARPGFEALGNQVWVAACTWQEQALPWLSANLNATRQALESALPVIEAGLEAWAPFCRLNLAYTHILLGHLPLAHGLIEQSEAEFARRGDRLNQARAWQMQASAWRRSSDYGLARQALERAKQVYEDAGAVLDLARAGYVLAYTDLWATGEFEPAESAFRSLARTFAGLDLPLTEAECYQGLSIVYQNAGNLSASEEVLNKAVQVLGQHPQTALYGDSLVELGRLHMFRGNMQPSLELLERARQTYRSAGSERLAAMASMYQGRAFFQFGRFQQALQALEAAQHYFQQHDPSNRLAECELYLARTWAQLGRPEQAEKYLEVTLALYRQRGQKAFLAYACLRQGEVAISSERYDDARRAFQEAWDLAEELKDEQQSADARRMLGETYLAQQRWEAAWEALQPLLEDYRRLDLPLGEAAAQTALGELYAQQGDYDAAVEAWEGAWRLSQDAAPYIAWRAAAGKMRLAHPTNSVDALDAARQMLAALAQVRRNFRQPALVGAYLKQPAVYMDEAVQLALEAGADEDLLRFIEESKAQTLGDQLRENALDVVVQQQARQATPVPELEALMSEIRSLQDRLRTAGAASRLRNATQAGLVQLLRQKNHQYDELVGRLERQHLAHGPEAEVGHTFRVEVFRTLAKQWLGQQWAAVDFYLDEAELTGVMLTPNDVQVWNARRTSQVGLALDVCANVLQSGHTPNREALATLGNWLLPPEALERLQPETVLVVAPHRQLHQVPWTALVCQGEYLIHQCIPVLAPSLASMLQLWRRAEAHARVGKKAAGLVLAAANFDGRRPALPETVREAENLQAQLEGCCQALVGSAAGWDHLRSLAPLDSYAFWHIASHAFHDPLTGRLSGIALQDQDIWLDQLWELAPLPELVTLSACSGMQSQRYEGDEATGLATTCLAAGAKTVVGSLWPVRDDRAAQVMLRFYDLWQRGCPPALALAYTQRQVAAGQSHDLAEWGGFLCYGDPAYGPENQATCRSQQGET